MGLKFMFKPLHCFSHLQPTASVTGLMNTLNFFQNYIMQTIKTIFFTVLTVLFFMFCWSKCTSGDPVIIENKVDTIRIKKDNEYIVLKHHLKIMLAEVDSLKNLKPVIKIRYLAKVDITKRLAPDTCQTYIDQLVKEHDHMDKLNDLIITGQEKVISNQDSIIKSRNEIIAHTDSVNNILNKTVTNLTKSLNKANKKAKRNFWVGLGLGGLVAGGGAALIKR